ncbi:polygalacturonase-like [Papaver somniferum]|nr:polygalacturonase-like [Papaver somniferum]
MANLIVLFSLQLIVLLFIVAFPLSTSAATYNVLHYGAKPNGRTDSTKPFLLAWSMACKSKKPATMWIPRGTYLVKTIVFGGPCKSKRVTVQIDGKIQAPPSKNFRIIGNYRNWILFHGIYGLTINGGILDGRGSNFWDCRRAGANCPDGAVSLTLQNVRNGIISGLKSIDSQYSHMAINGCNNIMVRRVTLIAPDQSPNTDGIDIQSSTGVTIIDSSIRTGDDCIAIGPGTKKVLVQRVGCGPGHGISIGSLARSRNEDGVEGIIVKDVTFTGSDNGLRIKTWPKPSNGFVKNVLYQNIVMNNVRNPIIIDQIYCPGGNSQCTKQHSGIKISGVTYLNVRGTSATPVAIKLHCSAINPCNGIELYHVKLTYSKKPATSFCSSATGISKGQVLHESCF